MNMNMLKLYKSKVKVGGYIAGHDYKATGWMGVTKAINETLGYPDEVFRDGSWIFKKML